MDWRRLYDFTGTTLAEPVPPDKQRNEAKRIDTRLVNPLDHLPAGAFAGREQNLPKTTSNATWPSATSPGRTWSSSPPGSRWRTCSMSSR